MKSENLFDFFSKLINILLMSENFLIALKALFCKIMFSGFLRKFHYKLWNNRRLDFILNYKRILSFYELENIGKESFKYRDCKESKNISWNKTINLFNSLFLVRSILWRMFVLFYQGSNLWYWITWYNNSLRFF